MMPLYKSLGFLGAAVLHQWLFHRTGNAVLAIAAGFYAVASVTYSIQFIRGIGK